MSDERDKVGAPVPWHPVDGELAAWKREQALREGRATTNRYALYIVSSYADGSFAGEAVQHVEAYTAADAITQIMPNKQRSVTKVEPWQEEKHGPWRPLP